MPSGRGKRARGYTGVPSLVLASANPSTQPSHVSLCTADGACVSHARAAPCARHLLVKPPTYA